MTKDDDRPCPCGKSHTIAEHNYDPDKHDGPDPDDAELLGTPDMDDSEMKYNYVVEFHNEAHTPSLRHKRDLDDEAGLRWYLNEMINWSQVGPSESIVIRRVVV